MIEIQVGWKKSTQDQVRLHVIQAVSDAVQGDHRVREERMSVPQYVPAGLGSTVPLKSKVDLTGSAMVERLDRALVAAALTGSDRDQQRVEAWERQLRELDMYRPDPSSTPREKRGHIRTLPSPVYAVRIRELHVVGPGVEIYVPHQRLELDLTEGRRTAEQAEALRTVLLEEQAPVSGSRGEQLRRAPRVRDPIWDAWNVLADMLDVAQTDSLPQLNCVLS